MGPAGAVEGPAGAVEGPAGAVEGPAGAVEGPAGAVVPRPGEVLAGTVPETVVWCTASGLVLSGPARCPHLAESLVDAGVVVGEDLVCAAHGWRVASDGEVVKQAMSGRRDHKGRVVVTRLVP